MPQVHDPAFVSAFSSGTLSEVEMRRIGFGEVTRHADLIERTKAEVAGHMLHMSCHAYTLICFPSTLARTGSNVCYRCTCTANDSTVAGSQSMHMRSKSSGLCASNSSGTTTSDAWHTRHARYTHQGPPCTHCILGSAMHTLHIRVCHAHTAH